MRAQASARAWLALTLVFAMHVSPSSAAWSQPVAALMKTYAGQSHTVRSVTPMTGYTFSWIVDRQNTKLYAALEADTTGWVGFGLAEAAGMRGADIVQGHVDTTTGKAHVADFHGVGNQQPVKDGCQDWNLHYGEQQSSKTLLIVSRNFTTQDSNDRPILVDTIKRTSFLFAFGSANDDGPSYSYHGTNRVKATLDLSAAAVVTQESWSAGKASTAGLTKIDLRAGECSPVANDGSRSQTFEQPDPQGQLIPAVTTKYAEFCYTSADHSGWAPYSGSFVAFEGLKDPQGRSTPNIHHFVLYGYDQDGCVSSASETIIWVGGVNFFEDLPTGVGMPFSNYRSFRLQVHYDNPLHQSGIRDNGGVRLWLSSNPVQHHAGTLQLGDGTLNLGTRNQNITIPPGRSYYSFTCNSATTAAWPHDITVFGSLLHMHKQGDQMYTEIIDSNGQVKSRPNSVEYFDFDHQDPTLVQPYTISRGDQLITRCYFNNVVGTARKPLKFGLGSDQEMCIDFLYYYPANSQIKQHCTFGHNGHFGGTYNPATDHVSNLSPAGMRVFGVNAGTPDDPQCVGGATVMKTAFTAELPGGTGGSSAVALNAMLVVAAAALSLILVLV